MTGTSMDGLDAALVRIEGAGLTMRATLLDSVTASLESVRERLSRLAAGEAMTVERVVDLNHRYSQLHVSAVQRLLGQRRADLVVVHGQTVFHRPPLSWQMISAPLIAHAIGAPVVFDLRAADLAAGGQGAPITPLADWIVYAHDAKSRTIVNLGGFANYTQLPARSASASGMSGIRAGDICVCNLLLNRLADQFLGRSFDDRGVVARSGRPIARLEALVREGLEEQSRSGRSLGTGDDDLMHSVLDRQRSDEPQDHAPEDVLCSVVHALARVIAAAVSGADEVVLAGGGARHEYLVERIEAEAGRPCMLSSKLGVPVEFREAMEMAVLGALSQDRIPITLPQVTGVREPAPRAGVWVYP